MREMGHDMQHRATGQLNPGPCGEDTVHGGLTLYQFSYWSAPEENLNVRSLGL